MSEWLHLGRWLRAGEQGQGLVEYGLVLVLTSIASITIMGTMGSEILNLLATAVSLF